MDDHCTILKNLALLVLESRIEILLPHQLPDEWIQTLLELNDQQNSDDAVLILSFAVLLLANHQEAEQRIKEIRTLASPIRQTFKEGIFKTFRLDLAVSKMAMIFGGIDIYVTYLRLELLRRHRIVKKVSELTPDNLFCADKCAVVTFYNPSTENQELEEYVDHLITMQPTASYQFH